jgi:hypothetical protein
MKKMLTLKLKLRSAKFTFIEIDTRQVVLLKLHQYLLFSTLQECILQRSDAISIFTKVMVLLRPLYKEINVKCYNL